MRGYIAMLATREEYRGRGIATKLVRMAVQRMKEQDADEVSRHPQKLSSRTALTGAQIALETEVDNIPSLRIYENLGFLRTKRLHRYYLSGNAAFRLILYLKPGIPYKATYPPEYPPDHHYHDLQNNGSESMEADLIARQAAQLQIEDVHNVTHDVRGSHA